MSGVIFSLFFAFSASDSGVESAQPIMEFVSIEACQIEAKARQAYYPDNYLFCAVTD